MSQTDAAAASPTVLTPADGVGYEFFGGSVAVDGRIAVIGAPAALSGRGAAYVYQRTGTSWSQIAKLRASDGHLDANFGAVAIDGDVIVVGAPRQCCYRGAIYVFVKPAGGWSTGTETATLYPGDPLPDFAGIGRDVDVEGDTVVAAVPGGKAVYVFEEPAGGWEDTTTHTAKLTASDEGMFGGIGTNVAIDGGTVIAGGTDGTNGAGYVFVKPSGGWVDASEDAQLTASDGVPSDSFWFDVDIDGDTAVVGAVGDDANRGSLYVFERPLSGWSNATETAKLRASDRAAEDQLGYTVAVDGDNVVGGALGYKSYRGAVYSFLRPSAGWSNTVEVAKRVATDGKAEDFLGLSLFTDGRLIFGGAPRDDVGDHEDQGTVRIFHVAPRASIGDIRKLERDTGTHVFDFVVTLSEAPTATGTLQYETADVSARAGTDYLAKSGNLTFRPGETTKHIRVTVNGDERVEENEKFAVRLSRPSRLVLADRTGIGTILNDD